MTAAGIALIRFSLAKYNAYKKGQAQIYRTQGFDKKTASKKAGKDADTNIPVHHCRSCADKGCGCCAKGIDIRKGTLEEE